MNRRSFLAKAGLAACSGALLPARLAPAAKGETRSSTKPAKEDFYARLGVRPVINAMGTVTFLGGSIMEAETLAAMEEASKRFVVIEELLEKAGEHLARIIGVDAALITSGAASAITLGTAACVAGGDLARIQRLPDTTGMRREIIIQKAHRNEYETQMLLVGAKLVVIETREEFAAAVNDRTAMLFFMNKADPKGMIRREEWVALGKKHGIPTYADAAADVPPKEHLSSYVKMGFDLVGFSGGKGFRGPQSTGLLLGRRDLVDAARLNASPYDRTIGRAMKVGKEEIAGLVTAIERYLASDFEAGHRRFESRVRTVAAGLSDLKSVRTEVAVPEIANHIPHLAVSWDLRQIPLTSREVRRRLMEAEPRIAVLDYGENAVGISPAALGPGEPEIVAERLRRILSLN